jgi:hypothetical protein
MTQKARRKASAAAAKDSRLFKRTEFGRKRIRALPVRIMLGLIVLVGIPFVFVYRKIRRAK